LSSTLIIKLILSTSNVNQTLKRKLAKALALLQSEKISFDKDLFVTNSSQSLKQNMGNFLNLSFFF
jgi:hypothetical protein